MKNLSVLFVCAMQEEYDAFIEELKAKHVTLYSEYHEDIGYVTSFKVNGRPQIVLAVGISYFSAFKLVNILKDFEPDLIINFGTCASLIGAKAGDEVYTPNCRSADLDLTQFGYIMGTVRKGDTEEITTPVQLSGSKFLTHEEDIEYLKSLYPTAIGFDMESFAIATLAEVLRIPFVVDRAVSDGGSGEEFEKNLKFASSCSARYALSKLQSFSNKEITE